MITARLIANNVSYYKLYDGPNAGYPEMARVCGSSLPSPSLYRSSTNSMFVKMRTDSSVSGRGFKANFSAGMDYRYKPVF